MAQTLLSLVALGAAFYVRRHVAPEVPLPGWQRLALGFAALIGAAFGAKLPFLLTDLEGAYRGTAFLVDGRTLTWGFVGGYAAVEATKLSLAVRVRTGDSFAPAVAVAIAIGRLGCFVGGCCFGVETGLPWACDFGDGVPRHPTQLYEAAFHFAAFAWLLYAERRGLLVHRRLRVYLIAYFAFRLVTEWLRPEPALALGLTFYQWSSLVFLALFTALLIFDRDPRPSHT